MEISGSSSSVQGIQNAFATHAARGKRIAQPDGGPRFEKDMAELPSDGDNVAANAKAIKTRDQMLGTLLDMVG
ncbi:MAG TPA: hypothetical protein VJ385_04000 [Fibrobacteria bacterium]|nr:hypothetical protein [Fibrobacteria bacterium]